VKYYNIDKLFDWFWYVTNTINFYEGTARTGRLYKHFTFDMERFPEEFK